MQELVKKYNVREVVNLNITPHSSSALLAIDKEEDAIALSKDLRVRLVSRMCRKKCKSLLEKK